MCFRCICKVCTYICNEHMVMMVLCVLYFESLDEL